LCADAQLIAPTHKARYPFLMSTTDITETETAELPECPLDHGAFGFSDDELARGDQLAKQSREEP